MCGIHSAILNFARPMKPIMTSEYQVKSQRNNIKIPFTSPDTTNISGIITRSQLKRLSLAQDKQPITSPKRVKGRSYPDELLSTNTKQTRNRTKEALKFGKDTKDQNTPNKLFTVNTRQTSKKINESVKSYKNRESCDELPCMNTSQTGSRTKQVDIQDKDSLVKSCMSKVQKLSRGTSSTLVIPSFSSNKKCEVAETQSLQYIELPNNLSLTSYETKTLHVKGKIRSHKLFEVVRSSGEKNDQMSNQSFGMVENETWCLNNNTGASNKLISRSKKPGRFSIIENSGSMRTCNMPNELEKSPCEMLHESPTLPDSETLSTKKKHYLVSELADAKTRFNNQHTSPKLTNTSPKSLKESGAFAEYRKIANKNKVGVSERNSCISSIIPCTVDLVRVQVDKESRDKNIVMLSENLLFDNTPHTEIKKLKNTNKFLKSKELVISEKEKCEYLGESQEDELSEVMDKEQNLISNFSRKSVTKSSKPIGFALLGNDLCEEIIEQENTYQLPVSVDREEHMKLGSPKRKHQKSSKTIEHNIYLEKECDTLELKHNSKSNKYTATADKLELGKEILNDETIDVSELEVIDKGIYKCKEFASISKCKSSCVSPIRKNMGTVECIVKRKKQNKNVSCEFLKNNLHSSPNKIIVHSRSLCQNAKVDTDSEGVNNGCSKVGFIAKFNDSSERSIERKANLAVIIEGQSHSYFSVSNERNEMDTNYNITSFDESNVLMHETPVTKSSPCNLHIKQENIAESFKDSDSDAESRKAIMKSAQKRIEQSLSTSESDSKRLLRATHKSTFIEGCDESESESAPDDMTFDASRKVAMESLRNAVESIQREKQRKKARRKERLEKLKQEKEEKLIRLKERLASQEDASCSSSEESGYEEESLDTSGKRTGKLKVTIKSKFVKTEKENVKKDLKSTGKITHLIAVEADDSAVKKMPTTMGLKRLPADVLDRLPSQVSSKIPKVTLLDEKLTKKKKKKNETVIDNQEVDDFKSPSNLDYIPLKSSGATQFGVVALEMVARTPKSIAQKAVDFRQNMLFGSRIVRESAKNNISVQQKRKASVKNRFVR